jgi:hypothetical protein
MEEIRQNILYKWPPNKFFNINNLTFENIEHLYNLYDEIAFNFQIKTRIQLLNKKLNKFILLTFNSIPEESVEINRLCGIAYYENKDFITYNVQISPWIITRMSNLTEEQIQLYFKNNNAKREASLREPRPKGDPQSSIIISFVLAFEHQLLHLLILLWNYNNYPVHGKLFECTEKAFFEITEKADIINIISNKNSYPQLTDTFKSVSLGRYKYWSNSCFLDSLTSILYFSISQEFRNAIFTTNVDLINYSIVEEGEIKLFKLICDSESKIDSEEKFREIVKDVQNIMFSDYMSMLNNNMLTCKNLRETLKECYTNMQINGDWDIFNASEIYSLFVSMFPKLAYINYPEYLHKTNGKIKKIKFQTPKPLFTFWEFMDTYEDVEGDYKTIDWDEFNTEILVFRNGGVPSIINFGSLEPETINSPIFEKVEKDVYQINLPVEWKKFYSKKYDKNYYFNKETNKSQWEIPSGTDKIKTGTKVEFIEKIKKITIKKARVFREYIINNRYEMVGSLILHGTSPGKEGGSHYTAYIKISSEIWIEYNDIGNVWRELKEFPNSCLVEKKGRKPEMYFYRRIQ